MSIKSTVVRLAAGVGMAAERWVRGSRSRVDIGGARCVLVLEYMLPLGCCVHMTPVFEAIKRDRPEVVIVVASRGLGASLLRHSPFVDHVIETADALTDTLGAAREIRAGLARLGLRADCALTGASDRRTRIALVGLLSGAGWRGGFTLVPEIYQRALEYRDDLSLIDNNLRLAGLVGCGEEHVEPWVFFSAADVAAAEGIAWEANPEGSPLAVLVTQNSGGQRTGWHTERFVEVIRYVDEVLGCRVVYVGTAADDAAVKGIIEATGGIGVSAAGRTSVTELAALLAMSDVVVSLDTGTMHVGRAVGVPMVVLGPSWQRPLEWLPLGIPQVRIRRGEDREGIPEGYRLDEISAADVTEALRELMLAYPANAESRAERVARGLSTVDHRAPRNG